jgi:hypothetical protein
MWQQATCATLSSDMRILSPLAIIFALAAPTASADSSVWDDFHHGLTVDAPGSKWFHFSAGPFVADDGVTSTSAEGLRVVARGVNPGTGEPAFTKTVGQEEVNGGLPGGLDHPKFLVYANHTATSGVPGFDAPTHGVLSFETWLTGSAFGNRQNPFGPAVVAPDDDVRLATYAFNCIDFETFMVFDTFLTDRRVYAFYERLPFGRDTLGDYAAFSYAIPLAERSGWEHIRLAYDRSRGTVSWYLNDRRAFQVTRIGRRIDRRFMLLDHGGNEQDIAPRQLDCGFGTFTLLDGEQAGRGLVRLSTAPGFYWDTRVGAPFPEAFVDDHSVLASRLWGEGALLQARRLIVSRQRES